MHQQQQQQQSAVAKERRARESAQNSLANAEKAARVMASEARARELRYASV
jgi:hypothetical protein